MAAYRCTAARVKPPTARADASYGRIGLPGWRCGEGDRRIDGGRTSATLGTMTYGNWTVEFDDRLLAHLQLVIVQRFRNQERFAMSWIDGIEAGSGRSSIWLHPEGDLSFRFNGSRVPEIDPEWINTLTESAQSSRGLIVTLEDGRLARSTSTKRT